ncbi:MAG: PspC domain-containing protein [Bacteroidia bacterium]
MNKTVTINISGIIFHIEEDAYEKLSKYLSTIRGYFSTAEGRDEIMADIEARIAELLKEKTNAVKQVVIMADVDNVIAILGKPEDFAGDTEHTASDRTETASTSEAGKKRRRRVFRDPDGKILGGVCSGIANYFNFDPLWIRLALVIMFFGFGTGFLLYIILWIIMPEAKTTAEKLEMRGEKVDINNISKTVQEEVEGTVHRAKANSDKFLDFMRDIFGGLFRILGRVFGVFFILFAIVLMIALVGSLFGITTIDGTNAGEIISGIFTSEGQQAWMVLGAILLIGVPALMIMYKGVKMLFRIKYHNRWLNMSAGILWLIGILISISVGFSVGREFAEDGRSRTAFNLQPVGDTLILKLNEKDRIEGFNDNYTYYGTGHRRHFRISNRSNDWMITEKGNKKVFVGFPTMNIVESETNNFELYIIKSSSGTDRKSAYDRARTIDYQLFQSDSLLTFNNYFSIALAEKWRNQDVEVLLKVPVGKVIYLDKSLAGFIYGIDNVTNTYDGDMVGRRWKMTSLGLECIDCEGLETNNEDEYGIPVPPAGPNAPVPPININDKDANVKVDENGINIKSKDANINIGKNGIQIETKENKGSKGNK